MYLIFSLLYFLLLSRAIQPNLFFYYNIFSLLSQPYYLLFLLLSPILFQSFKYINITSMSDDGDNDLQFDNGDQDFNDHDGAISENADGEAHEENHIDYYKDQGSYDMDQSFQADTDTLLKVKAKIMFNLNKERQQQQIPMLYEDLTLSSIAMQYASSIKNGHIDEAYLNRLVDQQKFLLDYLTCQIISKYEDDINITKKYTEKFFVETAYVFFEMDTEKQVLMDPTNTHIGIGLAGNSENIVIIFLVTQKDLAITDIIETEEDKVEVKGKILSPNHYVFMADIYDHHFQEIAESMYDRVQFNRQTKQFVIKIDVKTNWKQRRWIQIFTTPNEPIGTRKPSKERKNKIKKDLNDKFLSLFIQYPDERYLQCYNDEIHAEQNHQENESGMVLDSIGKDDMNEQQKQQSQSEKPNEDEDDQDDENQGEKKQEQSKQPKTSNKQIKQQLQAAISEAKNAYDNVVYQNTKLQSKIKQFREKHGITLDKIGEASMNEHKYLNILAQVHQTRMELQLTQERYNRMSIQLQGKLNQKQMKCNQIRSAFQDLKREVAKKATYSRSDQPIKPHKIDQWQQAESKLTQELQSLRLQILRARNNLAKNQKILKKKEELAEGLHLIDFEQLKIENQTLNEKIEERNEDLHKLKKKTTTMVQILTHTRQKLVFVEKMKQDLVKSNQNLDLIIQGLRGQINSSKQRCQKLRLQIQDAKQDVQIVNSQQLVVDYKKRAQHIQKLQEQLKQMLEKQKQMKTVIQMYQRKLRKQAVTK